MATEALQFGLLADSQAQLTDLAQLVEACGHRVAVSLQALSGALQVELPEVDAWVVRLNLQEDSALAFVERLESQDVPVIYDDIESYGKLGLNERVNRFSAKLQVCAGAGGKDEGRRAEEIWVLAASTGGPEAVATFFRHLPDELDGVAFIYVQHINPEISISLKKALLLNTRWQVVTCERSRVLRERSIYVVPPDNQVEIYDSGVIAPNSTAWLGAYRPSADQVMARVARKFAARSGAIVFSGMGDDGSKSCTYMRRLGGVIWAQLPDTCAVDSMPVSAIKTGMVSYQGSPERLAKQFVYGRHMPPKAANR
ncbi:chemosensory pili system protein ChpB (putative protein-glutamate methylesterase) [Alteromonadaceae bacterium 2753L.S.0a.02]|nr:chemosensory pili system protein ChpB (putative protein-glutamate methylesterase) [Alteromonadaceae bacterium 2753L.S.0a.02]